MTEYTDEEKAILAEFRDMDDEEQRVVLFDTVMSLLTDAVADNDMAMIKAYARLATEGYNNYINPTEDKDANPMGKV